MPARDFIRLSGKLREILKRHYKQTGIPVSSEGLKEVSLEANPDDVTEEKGDAWQRGGVTRVSVGVQSFSTSELRMLGRRHDPVHLDKAFGILRERFSNISIDLIFGIPGQTLTDWEETLKKAVEMQPDHISCYSLSYDERTALTLLRNRGERCELAEEDVSVMFDSALQILGSIGYNHYEVSNFARPGLESVHNSAYWEGNPYVGLGPSASSFDGCHTRRTNSPDIRSYLRNPGGEFEEEALGHREKEEEYILTRLRRSCGMDMGEFGRRFGADSQARVERAALSLRERGLVEVVDHGEERRWLRASPRGWMLLDSVIVELLP